MKNRARIFLVFVLCFGCSVQSKERNELSNWVKQVESIFEPTNVSVYLKEREFKKLNLTFGPRDPDKQAEILEQAIKRSKDPVKTNIYVKALVQGIPTRASDSLVSLLNYSKLDNTTRQKVLHCLALLRCRETTPVFIKHFEHEDVMVRSAAIDGFGILRDPAYSLKNSGLTQSRPYVDWHVPIFPARPNRRGRESENVAFPPPSVRNLLQEKLRSKYLPERQAAARSLVNWPPENYELRVAEWGIWFNTGENLTLVQSVIDEIPDFVHRTQNHFADLAKRKIDTIIIAKPIIHFTTKDTIAVDLIVSITHGQPWFAYPKPNDYFIEIDGPGKELRNNFLQEQDRFDDLLGDGRVPFSKAETGYPWLVMKPRQFMSGGDILRRSELTGIGLEWQSLIVSPDRDKQLKLQNVVEKKTQWWNRLRQVNSSWIETRNETERFVFYDGPTSLPSFYRADREKNEISLSVTRGNHKGLSNRFFRSAPVRGLHVNVSKEGTATGKSFEFEFDYGAPKKPERLPTVLFQNDYTLPLECELEGDNVKKAFRELIQVDGGLTNSEANGMIDVWENEFFKKPGERILFRISRVNYDFMCPLKVRPNPTEVSRVGIVLTELNDQ